MRLHERFSDLHGVRHPTTDVQCAAGFYTKHLGFTLEHQ